MRILLGLMTLAALTACSDSTRTLEPRQDRTAPGGQQVSLTATDAPAQPGILFIAGNAVGGTGTVTFTRTQYGSLCANELTARADVATGQITLFVNVAERLALCTADIRALTYRAELSGLAAGDYEISVVHTYADKSTLVVFTGRVKIG